MRYATSIALALLLLPAVAQAQTSDEVLSQFDAEPSILEVQRAATDHAQIDEGEMQGWRTRASTAALLPDVGVRFRRVTEEDRQDEDKQDLIVDFNEDLVLDDVERDVRLEDDEWLEIQVDGDWHLNELVWNPDLIRISDETRDLVELREDILTTVTSLYFERRRAQVQLLLNPPSDAAERIRRELEIQELTASLDALTGGWFSAELSQAGLPTY